MDVKFEFVLNEEHRLRRLAAECWEYFGPKIEEVTGARTKCVIR
jgi:hypothetical protein